jgi:hypothetical protein
LYCGRIAKGLPLYFAWFLVPLCITIAALVPSSPTALVLLVLLPAVAVLIVYCYAAIDAWRLAYQIGPGYSLRDYNRAGLYWLLIVVQLVYAIGLLAAVRGFVYEAFLIPTSSMIQMVRLTFARDSSFWSAISRMTEPDRRARLSKMGERYF